MGWREAWRLSSVAFTELSLQAIYSFRQGNLPPSGPISVTVRKARRRVVQSKVMIATFLALIAAGAALLVRVAPRIVASPFFGFHVSVPLFQAGVLTGLLCLDVAFLWWTGLQVLPTFISSGVLPVLEPLPIEERTLGRVAGLLYLRLFDIPALTVLIVTPLFVAYVLGASAGVAILPGVVAAESFALALALITGRFFVRRVQGSRGGGGRTLVRWGYLVLWVLPAFAMFGFIVVGPAFFALLGRTAAAGPSVGGNLLVSAFPFTFALLPAILTRGGGVFGLDAAGVGVLFVAAAVYLLLAAWAGVWLMGTVRRIGLAPPLIARDVPIRRYDLVAHGPARAVVTKDLRIASRMPGYAFLVIFPVLDAIALGLFTFIAGPGSAAGFTLALAAVTTAALLATFFGPAFFAIEVVAYSYGRTLPLTDRTLILGKAALIAAIYLVAGGVVIGLTLARVFQPFVFVSFVVAELPAVLAAAFLEMGILLRSARRKGLPFVSLYAGAWYAILVSVPGLLMAGLPLVAFRAFGPTDPWTGLLAMALLATGELAVCAPFALGWGRGRPA
ncbi:MAG: hypothetical protein WBF81_09865 [Thermoplasmata archaeon]